MVELQERLDAALLDMLECSTGADVAALLTREGVRGDRDSCQSCPIAKLVQRRLGPGVAVSVALLVVCAWLLDDDAVNAEVPMSSAMEEFVAGFDDGNAWQGLRAT